MKNRIYRSVTSIVIAAVIILATFSGIDYGVIAADMPTNSFTIGTFDEIYDNITYLNDDRTNNQQIIRSGTAFSDYATKEGHFQAKYAYGEITTEGDVSSYPDGTKANWVYNNFANVGAFECWGRTYKKVYSPYGDNTGLANDGQPSLMYKCVAGSRIEIPVCVPTSALFMLDYISFSYSSNGRTWKTLNPAIAETSTYRMAYDYTRTIYSVRIAKNGYFRITFPNKAQMKGEMAAAINSGAHMNGTLYVIPPAVFPIKSTLKSGSADIVSLDDCIDGTNLLDNSISPYASVGGRVWVNKLSNTALNKLTDYDFLGDTHECVYTPDTVKDSNYDASYIEYSVEADSLITIPIGMVDALSSLWSDFKFEFSEDGNTFAKISDKHLSYYAESDVLFSDKYDFAKGTIKYYSIRTNKNGVIRITFPKTDDLNSLSEGISGYASYTREGAVFIVPASSPKIKAAVDVGESDVIDPSYFVTGTADILIDNSLAPYANTTGSVWAYKVGSWASTDIVEHEFSGRTCSYFYTPNCYYNDEAPPTVSYTVKADTRLEFSVGMIDSLNHLWSDLKIEISYDNTHFSSIDENLVSFVTTGPNLLFSYNTPYTKGEIRTYAIENVKDAFIKITFPPLSKINEVTLVLNKTVIFSRNGAIFLTPAIVKAPATDTAYLRPKANQTIVSMKDSEIIVNSLLTVEEFENYLIKNNLDAKFFDGANEITDKSLSLPEDMKIVCYANGASDYEDGEKCGEYTVVLDLTEDVLITTKLTLKNGSFDKINGASIKYGASSIIQTNNYSSYAVRNGSIQALNTDGVLTWALRNPNGSNTFTVFGQTYDYVYGAFRDNTKRYIKYKVEQNTKVRIPIAVPVKATALLDMFKVEVSTDDGETWSDAEKYFVPLKTFVIGTNYLTYTMQICTIKFEQDSMLRISFPDATETRKILTEATGNDGIDTGGGMFMIPASGWDINATDEFPGESKKVMEIGSYDTLSKENIILNSKDKDGNPINNGDSCIDNATTEYVFVEGNVKACATTGWVFAPAYTFTAFDRYYDYVYTPYRAQYKNKQPSIMYSVVRGSEIQAPIACPTQYLNLYDNFKFMYSADGVDWTELPKTSVSYTTSVIEKFSTQRFSETIRTYSLQVLEDGYLKIVFPDIETIFSCTKTINNSKNFCDSGSVFICPPTAQISQKGSSVTLNKGELFTTLGTNSITHTKETSDLLTTSEFSKKFNFKNCYFKYFDASMNELTLDNQAIDSVKTIQCFARGSLFNADNELLNTYTFNLTNVTTLEEPTVVSTNSQVDIDWDLGCITVSYDAESPCNVQRMLSMLKFIYSEYKLVDGAGLPYTNTSNTVGTDAVYLEIYSKNCPYATDGVLIASFELTGAIIKNNMSFTSLNLDKVVIDYDNKVIYFEDNMTIYEFKGYVNIVDATPVFRSVPDASFNTVPVEDSLKVITSGMSLELQVGAVGIYYDLVPYSDISGDKTVIEKIKYTVTTKGTPSDRPLIIGIIGGTAAAFLGVVAAIVIILIKRKKKRSN